MWEEVGLERGRSQAGPTKQQPAWGGHSGVLHPEAPMLGQSDRKADAEGAAGGRQLTAPQLGGKASQISSPG